MFGAWTYGVWLALFVGLPWLGLVSRYGRVFWLQRRALTWVLLGALAGGWAWDALAVRLGLWYYRSDHLVGLWFGGLPVEEWLWIAGVALLFSSLTLLLAERAGMQP